MLLSDNYETTAKSLNKSVKVTYDPPFVPLKQHAATLNCIWIIRLKNAKLFFLTAVCQVTSVYKV